MKEEFAYIGQKIIDNRYQLAESLSEEIQSNTKEHFEKVHVPKEQYIEIRAELMGYFGEVLLKEKRQVHEKVASWAERVGEMAIQHNVSLTEALRIISLFRPVIWKFFTDKIDEAKLSSKSVIAIIAIFDEMISEINEVVGSVHERHNRKLMEIAYSALEELSVPVVPLTKGIAVIPLVGSVDTHRAKLIMEVALNESSRLKLQQVIFDVSGVAIIDTMVGDALFKIVQALRLIGVETTITGIRPAIAQTITSLGIDLANIKTCGSMQQALQETIFFKEKASTSSN